MSFLELAKKRCSCRNFNDQQVPEETLQYILEAGIHYGCLCGYNAVQGVNLFVGVVHILHLVYKPCIAVGVWVEDGNGLSLLPCREDEVFGV